MMNGGTRVGAKLTLYKVGEVARLCGVSRRTVDFYTRLGLLCPQTRSGGNYRLYTPECLRRIHRIQELKQQRLTLEEIRRRLEEESAAPEPSAAVMDAVQAIAGSLERLQQQVAELQQMASRAPLDAAARSELQAALHQTMARGLALAQSLLLLAEQGVLPYA